MSKTPTPKKKSPDAKEPTLRPEQRRRLTTIAIVALALGILVGPNLFKTKTVRTFTYSAFLAKAEAHAITSASVENATGTITGVLSSGVHYTVSGPMPVIPSDVKALRKLGVTVKFANPSSFTRNWLPLIEMLVLFVLLPLFIFTRLSKGQMGGMMSIGKSKAKKFDEDHPTTTFADVAGYI